MKALEDKKRSWTVVEFEVAPQHEDMASWLMIQLGANGCQLIAKTAEIITLQASFELDKLSTGDLSSINSALDEYGLGQCLSSLRSSIIEEEDWLAEWKKGFTPLRLGEEFLVCPPWLAHELTEEDLRRKVIYIEPGLAFGTGFHATTQFCLRALESHKSYSRVLDVGSGSGILAIAAALDNPSAEITALEIDPIACKVAVENLQINKVDKLVKLIEGSVEKISGQKFDLIFSNLTCEDNIALLPDYLQLLEPGGSIIMSGILAEKLSRLHVALGENGCTIVKSEIDGMWAGLVVNL